MSASVCICEDVFARLCCERVCGQKSDAPDTVDLLRLRILTVFRPTQQPKADHISSPSATITKHKRSKPEESWRTVVLLLLEYLLFQKRLIVKANYLSCIYELERTFVSDSEKSSSPPLMHKTVSS